MSINEDLRELAELHDAGTLSDEEFEVAKERLLHGDQATEAPQAPPTKKSGCRTALVVILVIVISIPAMIFALGLFATVAVQNVPSILDRASKGTVKANITTICQAVDNFTIINNGRRPESLEQLVTPNENGETFMKGRKVPADPWGREFLYDPPMSGTRGYKVYTLGKDGIPGGEGEDMDINNWMIEDGKI